MHSQLNHMIVQQRSTELQRARVSARPADIGAGEQSSRRPKRITRLTGRLTGFTARFAPTRP